MVFAKYSPVRKNPDRAIVAITKKRFQLNSMCQERYFKGCEYAELYFDMEKKIIGIKPLKDESKDTVVIRRYEDRGTAVIAATNFIKEFKIDEFVDLEPKKATGFRKRRISVQIPADWDKENGLVILKLGL